MMKQGDNDVGIDGAVPIVRPLSTTTVVDQSASVQLKQMMGNDDDNVNVSGVNVII